MLARIIIWLLQIALMSKIVVTLEYQKSFLLIDGPADVHVICIFRNSILLPAYNDIVQRDIETGEVQRTFRAHTKRARTFVVTDDNRMISWGEDDMIIVWDLISGSIAKKIWLGATPTEIKRIIFRDNQLFTCGLDTKIRQIDLTSGKTIQTINTVAGVWTILLDDNYLYVSIDNSQGELNKYLISPWSFQLRFVGHTASVSEIIVFNERIISSDANGIIFAWNKETGEIMMQYYGFQFYVFAMTIFGDTLLAGGAESSIKRWNIDSGEIIRTFAHTNYGQLLTIQVLNGIVFTGSSLGEVARWNLSDYSLYSLQKRSINVRATAAWKNYLISGCDDGKIRVYDSESSNILPVITLTGNQEFVFCLHVYENYLFSGGTDNLIMQWNLNNMTMMKIFYGHLNYVSGLASDSTFLYSGGYDKVVRKWNISSGSELAVFSGHTDAVLAVYVSNDLLFSGSKNGLIKVWNKDGFSELDFNRIGDIINVILVYDQHIVICTFDGLGLYDLNSGQELVYIGESATCDSLAVTGIFLFTGHGDGAIKSRDASTLSVLGVFSGHKSKIVSLYLDESYILLSSSYDGIIKKWDMRTRKVAFSFENRNGSVTSLTAIGNKLIIGTLIGRINVFNIDSGELDNFYDYHQKEVTSVVVKGQSVYSSGMDGLVASFSPQNRTKPKIMLEFPGVPIYGIILTKDLLLTIREGNDIIVFSQHETSSEIKTISVLTPVECLAVTDKFIFAGSRSGTIYAWSMSSFEPYLELKGHTSVVNYMITHKNLLYSASDDKTIIQWSLDDFSLIRVFQRYSASALGHLGPVYSLSLCIGVLFSGGADLSVRRWNTQTGKHEDVYFGFQKAVTAVLCHNGSVLAGSEDFSVLMFNPTLPKDETLETTSALSSRTNTISKKTRMIKGTFSNSSASIQNEVMVYVVLAVGLIILMFSICFVLKYRNTKEAVSLKTLQNTNATEENLFATDLATVVNSVMGISKHAAFLMENSLIAKTKKIATGGGGELFLAKLMGSSLRAKHGDAVIQKVIFITNRSTEEAFYQEIGIMIMLAAFPSFCSFIGYTENPKSIVLKYYPDGSLYEFLCKNKIGKNSALKILKELSKALHTMHSHFLAHCDLKTQNVLVEVNAGLPSCYLTDFGITQILSEKIIATKSFSVINLRGLSVQYAAPEAFSNFRSKNYSGVEYKKYDVYSYACVLYEVLARKFPWN
ncbi:hypothetical protein MP638_007413 [Amoeboaphelidium occidentale]|nr:hypothetical protein MP638_007413 [Amoeboaphelidium occidentale]